VLADGGQYLRKHTGGLARAVGVDKKSPELIERSAKLTDQPGCHLTHGLRFTRELGQVVAVAHDLAAKA